MHPEFDLSRAYAPNAPGLHTPLKANMTKKYWTQFHKNLFSLKSTKSKKIYMVERMGLRGHIRNTISVVLDPNWALEMIIKSVVIFFYKNCVLIAWNNGLINQVQGL